jgi:hypothetical protein
MNSGPDLPKEGFPHSDIRGSTIARISPRLFAACHVLHRLLAPRHPPNALVTLTIQPQAPARSTKPRTNHSVPNSKPTLTQHTLFPDSPVKERPRRRSSLYPRGLLEAARSSVTRGHGAGQPDAWSPEGRPSQDIERGERSQFDWLGSLEGMVATRRHPPSASRRYP